MASGYTVSGRGDLDIIFKARTGAARANVGYQVGSTDLAQRYEQRGSTTPVANTGYLSSGTDLAQLFMDKNVGSATHSLTAGFTSTNSGTGFVSGSYGSISPTQIGGKNIQWMYDYQTTTPAATYFSVALNSASAITKTFFTSVAINGTTYSTSAATFDATNAPIYIWTWIGRAFLVNGSVYPVTVT